MGWIAILFALLGALCAVSGLYVGANAEHDGDRRFGWFLGLTALFCLAALGALGLQTFA